MKPQTLRNRINRLIAFEDAIDDNIMLSVTDEAGVILYVNKKFCEVTQYAEADLLGKKYNLLNTGYHPKAFFTDMWNTIIAGNTWKGEIKNKCRDGQYYWADTVIVPMPGEHNTKEYLCMGILVTQRKDAETALSEAAFIVSHKIRQPFVNMQALLTFIMLEDMPVSELKSMAKLMQVELTKIDELTRQMALDLHIYRQRLAAAVLKLQP